MLVTMKPFRLAIAALPLVLIGSLMSSPVLASRWTTIVHDNLRAKILREAHDRTQVTFGTTNVHRISRRLIHVTGRGNVARGRKPRQRFTYRGTVDTNNGALTNQGYTIIH